MADEQSLPLMAVPQQNLFGGAADDLRSILAQRELQRRKDLLDSVKMQIDVQKANDESAKTSSQLATEAQNRGFAGPKNAADLAKSAAETTNLGDAHADAVFKQGERQKLGEALDAFDAAKTPDEQMHAGMKILAHGGKLISNDEVQAMQSQSNHEAIGKLIDAYTGEPDPNKKQAIGMQIMNLGGKGVPTPDATPFTFPGNGEAVGDTRTGVLRPTGFTPTAAAKAPIDPNIVTGALNTIKASGSTAGIPQDVLRAAIAEANKNGQTIVPLTAATRGLKEIAGAQLPTFDKLTAAANQMQSMGLMGTIGGRWRNLLAGEGLGDVSNLSPEQRGAIGNFATLAGLFTSGTMLAHFRGRGGPQAYEIMERLLAPGGKDFATYMADITAARGVLENYSKLGGVQDNVPAAPGSGKSGGPGPSTDPNNPLGLPRIK